MYDDNITAVRCAVGVTEGFEVKVGLHQVSALSPCFFAMVMDRMTDDIREEAPWTMMFTDDIVICSASKERVEEKLKSWRYALERRGMKVNRRKTEYMCVNERQVNGTVKMPGEEVAKVYIRGSVQVGWFWRKTREAKLKWYGHVRRRDDGYIGRRMLMMGLPGNRKWGRPKRRFMDAVRELRAVVEVTENLLWRPLKGATERRERIYI